MDGAFFMPAIFAFLHEEPGVDYAVKVPMWKWLGLREAIASRRRWEQVDAYVEGFEIPLAIPQWDRTERAVVYRKRVSHKSREKLPARPPRSRRWPFRVLAVATNKALGVRALWHFMAGRGAHRAALRMSAVPTTTIRSPDARNTTSHIDGPSRSTTWCRWRT